jgi:hypothetical protein
MQTFCDRCNEPVDHPIAIPTDSDLTELAGELGYRSVCSGCFDDLLAEAAESRELHAEGDRRAEERIPIRLALTIEALDGSTAKQAVFADDVSPHGLRVRGVRDLHEGTVVRVTTDGAEGEVEALAIVELVWHDGTALHAGLHLVEASPRWDQLLAEIAARYEPR